AAIIGTHVEIFEPAVRRGEPEPVAVAQRADASGRSVVVEGGEQELRRRVLDQPLDACQERVRRRPVAALVVAERDQQPRDGLGLVRLGAPRARGHPAPQRTIRPMIGSDGRCAACGAAALAPHMKVRPSEARGLVPDIDRYGAALADIVKCEACGHMQLERFPSEAELGDAYGEAASEGYVGEEAGQRATAAAVLEQIERHVPARGGLLDLGCWVGFLL